jgi:hypothetical protein
MYIDVHPGRLRLSTSVAMATDHAFLGHLLRSRATCVTLGAIGVAQSLLTAFGKPGLPCPSRILFDFPCAGCGLSRSVAAVLRGDPPLAVRLHAFGPLAAFLILIVAVAMFLPDRPRLRLADSIAAFENRTRAPLVLLILLLAYWLVRLGALGRHYV